MVAPPIIGDFRILCVLFFGMNFEYHTLLSNEVCHNNRVNTVSDFDVTRPNVSQCKDNHVEKVCIRPGYMKIWTCKNLLL